MRRTAAIAALWAACAATQAAPAEPVYNVKMAEPEIGSNIRKYVLLGDSRLPLNRTYAELSDAEQQMVRDQYEAMAPGDEPPFPADGLLPLYQAIAKGHDGLGSVGTGRMRLVATVNAKGDVEQVQVLGRGLPGLNQLVAQLLLVTRFKPAVCGGQPCKMDYPFTMNVTR